MPEGARTGMFRLVRKQLQGDIRHIIPTAIGPISSDQQLISRMQRVGMEVATGDPLARTNPRELLIDCEEDRTLRAVLVGMLRKNRR